MKTYKFTREIRWIISYITFLIIVLVAGTIYLYEPPIPEQEEPVKPPVFAYPLTDPEFLQSGNIIVCYEYIDENRHLIAIENNGDSYIMPLFNDRETAIDFMNQYFAYLKELVK